MEYKSLTKADRDLAIAEAIYGREVEHFHYDLNATNYTNLLDGMKSVPDVWPDELKYLQGRTRDEVIALARLDSDATAALAIMEKDRLVRMLKSEQHERDKVETYHAQLVAQFATETDLTTALDAAKQKRDAIEAARLSRAVL